VNPHFEFTDPPSRRSLPITLAFAASTSRPSAVLTGPHHRLGDWFGPAEPDPAADLAYLVRARIDGSPVTTAAALVWSDDLPRLLQQVRAQAYVRVLLPSRLELLAAAPPP
jgi:hypothetical protein